MTEKQDKARRRNFNVMVLRGMYVQLQRIKGEHPDLHLYFGDVQCGIDTCLTKMGAESQENRLRRK